MSTETELRVSGFKRSLPLEELSIPQILRPIGGGSLPPSGRAADGELQSLLRSSLSAEEISEAITFDYAQRQMEIIRQGVQSRIIKLEEALQKVQRIELAFCKLQLNIRKLRLNQDILAGGAMLAERR